MTLNIAHRGARGVAPENTLAAARKAREFGADLWETEQERMPRLLRGQFAFTLHDPHRNVAILARDRSGISPLFWAKRGDKLWFASEINALLATPETRARFAQMGGVPMPGSPEDFTRFVAAEIEKWRTVIRREGLQIDVS